MKIGIGGAGYNSYDITTLIQIRDSIRLKDSFEYPFATILQRQRLKILDGITSDITFRLNEYLFVKDASNTFAFFDLADKFHVLDKSMELFALIDQKDELKLMEEISDLRALITQDQKFSIDDIQNIEAFITQLQKFGLNDLANWFAFIEQCDIIDLLDRDPRKAVSDFVIGRIDNRDTAFKWFLPFGLMVHADETEVPIMPEAQSDHIEMQGIDGAIPEYTTYKNRMFNIVAYSQDGLNTQEKEELKKEICRILDATKQQPKKLTFLESDTCFDVKYSGQMGIKEGPSFIRVNVPLETSPYGYPLFDTEIFGSGLLVNNGSAPAGCIHKISAGAVNPSFQVGNISYKWNGTVPDGYTLVIDNESYLCYLEDNFGTRQNVLPQLTGDFQKIDKEKSVVIVANKATEDYLYTTFKEKRLW